METVLQPLVDFFQNFSPAVQALFGTLFTWGVTALGASAVFLTRGVSQKLLDTMLGFAAGVMIAASYWSLLAPSIAISEAQGVTPWLPPLIGFLLGGAFLRLIDMILPHLHPRFQENGEGEAEGIKSTLQKTTLMLIAITIHNIPEGMAVGVAFGATAYQGVAGFEATTIAAMALALGIGIQNFPEGTAVSMPLRREGMSKLKSFFWGQMSAIVEPISALIGVTAVLMVEPILPYALAFAAGAMIFVVIEDIIPEAQSGGNTDLVTLGGMLGFAVMMTLDVALG